MFKIGSFVKAYVAQSIEVFAQIVKIDYNKALITVADGPVSYVVPFDCVESV